MTVKPYFYKWWHLSALLCLLLGHQIFKDYYGKMFCFRCWWKENVD